MLANPPMRAATITATALLGLAALVWGVGVVDAILVRGGGFGDACASGRAAEGVGFESESNYWPPGTVCVVSDGAGGVVRMTAHEWPWVPAAVLALTAAASVCLAFAAVVARIKNRLRPS